jgi:hypothetical protein
VPSKSLKPFKGRRNKFKVEDEDELLLSGVYKRLRDYTLDEVFERTRRLNKKEVNLSKS